MAGCCTLLRAQQAERSWDVGQPFNQQVSCLSDQSTIAFAPLCIPHKEVPQFHQGDVLYPPFTQQPLNTFLRRFCLCIDAKAGPVRSEPYIDDRLDAVLLKEREKILGPPAAVAKGVALFIQGSASRLLHRIAADPCNSEAGLPFCKDNERQIRVKAHGRASLQAGRPLRPSRSGQGML